MILNLDQFAAVCDPAFPFDADFVARIEAGLREFLEADGMLAAGESPGALTELRENNTLLLLVLDGAKKRTTAHDSSGADGIVRLTWLLDELDDFCQRKTGLTLAELEEQFVLADAAEENASAVVDMPPAQASETALIDEAQAGIRASIGRQIVDGCNLIRHAGPLPLPLQERIARDAWNVATDTHRHISGLPMLETDTMDALTDLQTLIDALRNLLP